MSEARAFEPTVTRVKTVRVIPPTIQPLSDIPAFSARPRRVAAYARVSTSSEEQLTSYEAQVKHYTEYIKSKETSDNWQFVDVYTDKGITGVSTKKREGFNRMIQDALAGKIDLIITKSVSRFARNTEDTLTAIRKLKEYGVEVYFEEQNIYTLDGKGEVLLGVSKRGFKRNQRGRKEQKRNDSGSGIAFSACRSDYRPEQGRKEPPEDFPASEGNICCDAPAWEYNAVNQH